MYLKPIKSIKQCRDVFSELNSEKDNIDLSCLFWKEIFDTKNVIELLDFASSFQNKDELSENIIQFIESKNLEEDLQSILNTITSIGVDNITYFNTIETVTYLLQLFAEYYYNNFSLVLDTAFDIDANSINQITELAKNPEFNPYYNFLEKHFVPRLKSEDTELIFVAGRPSLFNFSQLFFVQKYYPSAKIFITRHSGEYYSLNKITKYLKNNEVLFSWVDGIILDDFEHTENILKESIKENKNLTSIPNLLLSTDSGIIQTPYKKRERDISEINVPKISINTECSKLISSSKEIFDTVLLNNNKCHWSGCSYCGINHKYPTIIDSKNHHISDYINIFEKVKNANYKLLFLQDEAIPIDIANEIANKKIELNNNIAWHYRSKIDIKYTDEFISTLSKSNLKGIYFGLESVNQRVLELMNKYDSIIDLNFIANLADKLFENNIHCHFCCIIGFPSETLQEISETLSFISKIKKKHPAFTFTVNIFEADIASPLFTKKEKYNLTAQVPVPDDLYIGNDLLFKRDIPYQELVDIKIKFLLKNITDSNSNISELMENPNSLINYINEIG